MDEFLTPEESDGEIKGQRDIEIDTIWNEPVPFFSYLTEEEWKYLATPLHTEAPERLGALPLYEEAIHMTVRLLDQEEEGKVTMTTNPTTFEFIVYPIHQNFMEYLMPTDEPPYIPFAPHGVNMQVELTPQGQKGMQPTYFVIEGYPNMVSPNLLTYDKHISEANTLVSELKPIEFALQFGEDRYVWRPKYAEFEEDETGKVTSAQLRGESQDALARREGKEVFPRSSFFVLPADPALYQDTTFVARK